MGKNFNVCFDAFILQYQYILSILYCNEVLYLAVEERNQEKRPTRKDQEIEECYLTSLTSLQTNPEIHIFNFAFPWIKLANSGTGI